MGKYTAVPVNLAALPEICEGLAEFLQFGKAGGGAVCLYEDVLHTRILGGFVDCLDGIVKSDQSDLSALDGGERVAFLSLFSDLEFRHVHQQDTLLGNNGAGASGE